jgi:hypothetical protein
MRLLPWSATKMLPSSAMERWRGSKKAAAVPAPSAHAALTPPAKEDAVPFGRMSLMRLPSPTKTFPLPSTATPLGKLKAAVLVPTPLETPLIPVPARVATAPAGVIFRMRQLPESATYTTPAESTARPWGKAKPAEVPCPSAQAVLPLPANVVATPEGVSILMRWL